MSTPGVAVPYSPPSRSSQDTPPSQSAAADRWAQRRLQRLTTEQGFRDQRQAADLNSKPASVASGYSSSQEFDGRGARSIPQELLQQFHTQQQQSPQSHHQLQNSSSSSRTPPSYTSSLTSPPPQLLSSPSFTDHSINSAGRTNQPFYLAESGLPSQFAHGPNQQSGYTTDPSLPSPHPLINHSRPIPQHQNRFLQHSTNQQPSDSDDFSPAAQANATLAAPKSAKSNRLSMQSGGGPLQSPLPPTPHDQSHPSAAPPHTNDRQQAGTLGRSTPQSGSEEMTPQEAAQLAKDHKELRMATYTYQFTCRY